LHLEHQSEHSLTDMSVSQMCVEDRLAGASNWSPWKARIIFVLEDLKLWDIVEAPVPILSVTTPILLANFRRRNNKAKRTICDAVRDHIIPYLTGKTYAYEMWASLCKLYESSNENRGAFTCSRMSRLLHSLVDTPRSETSLKPSERWWISTLW
jgi:hypothetical protein